MQEIRFMGELYYQMMLRCKSWTFEECFIGVHTFTLSLAPCHLFTSLLQNLDTTCYLATTNTRYLTRSHYKQGTREFMKASNKNLCMLVLQYIIQVHF